ncbi:hypothetical protein [Halogeometricum borinquense]|uniref:hypothetical protein n=1 Tax=Halogeometricum borinquense TaxID=60847 RepID=UPI001EF77337|nr:hypothetical protein [Halogeometricum borinquense]
MPPRRDLHVISERDLVSTYDPRQYDDAWDAVEQYRRVNSYHERNPEKGSSAVSNEFGLPRGRVHGWLHGGKPDQVKALSFGHQYGWFDATWEDEAGHAFNTLVAAVFAGGSIGARDYSLRFTLGKGHEAQITAAVERLAGGYRTVQDIDGRKTWEISPTQGQAPLARALVALGAPRGTKNADADVSLPEYLKTAPERIRQEFLQVYLTLRASDAEYTNYLTVRESRPDEFLDELAAFMDQELPAEVYRNDSIVVSPEAIDALDAPLEEGSLG